jgi:hypothetical protein
MKQVYKYDDEGRYVEPVLIGEEEEIPVHCTDVELPQPNFKPVFQNGAWVETITQEELDELADKPKQPLEERLSLSEEAIDFLLMDGGL